MGEVKQQEIAERKRLERELILIRTALDSASDAIEIADLTGRSMYHNRAFLNLFEYTVDELTRAGGVAALFADPAVAGEVLNHTLNGRSWSGEVITRTRLGQLVPLALRADRITDRQGKPLGLIVVCTDITERKLAEAALRESEQRFRALIEKSWDAIALVAGDGTILYASPSISRIMGYPLEQYVGQNGFDMLHPDDEPAITENFTQLLENPGGSVTVEFRARHWDGSWRWMESTATNLFAEPAVQAIVANYRDITERKQAEEQIRDQAKMLAVVQDAIIALDLAGAITYWNAGATALYGWPHEEAVGRPGQELLCRDQATRTQWVEVWRSVTGTGAWRGEVRQEGRHGQSFIAASRWVLLRDPDRGEARSILIVNTDITDSRRIEESLLEAVGKLAEQLDQPRLVGVSPAIKEITEMVRQAATSPLSYVLLTGERGVGKERVARAIHSATRCRGRFVGVNCAAFTKPLFESLLFGHERGAFTGATRRARGYVEQAAGGTLLLDEIDALSPAQQAKLNRVLEEREYQPLGSEESRALQARVIATSNHDLLAAARSGAFRADLYDRLAVLAIEVPPLREHREDVAPLAEYFVATLSAKLKLRTRGLSEEAREKLRRYQGDWPGNVRGLRNVIERALIRAQGGWITADGIIIDDAATARPATDASQAPAATEASLADPNRLIMDLVGQVSPEEVSRRMVQQALAGADDNQTVAAKTLGISRYKLRRLLKAHRDAG